MFAVNLQLRNLAHATRFEFFATPDNKTGARPSAEVKLAKRNSGIVSHLRMLGPSCFLDSSLHTIDESSYNLLTEQCCVESNCKGWILAVPN